MTDTDYLTKKEAATMLREVTDKHGGSVWSILKALADRLDPAHPPAKFTVPCHLVHRLSGLVGFYTNRWWDADRPGWTYCRTDDDPATDGNYEENLSKRRPATIQPKEGQVWRCSSTLDLEYRFRDGIHSEVECRYVTIHRANWGPQRHSNTHLAGPCSKCYFPERPAEPAPPAEPDPWRPGEGEYFIFEPPNRIQIIHRVRGGIAEMWNGVAWQTCLDSECGTYRRPLAPTEAIVSEPGSDAPVLATWDGGQNNRWVDFGVIWCSVGDKWAYRQLYHCGKPDAFQLKGGAK